jgi:hypothetical protein
LKPLKNRGKQRALTDKGLVVLVKAEKSLETAGFFHAYVKGFSPTY